MPTFVVLRTLARSANQEFSNHIRSSATVLFSTRANSTQNRPKDSHATCHDGAVLRLDAEQSLRQSLQPNPKTKLVEIVAVCRHQHVDQPKYD